MKVLILAAGKGTRMRELTQNTPKPLLKYGKISLIEHKLQNLPSKTSGLVIVINYLGHQIKEHLGNSYKGIPIQYVEQKEMLGTADALWQCKHLLKEPFMVLMSDDLYSKEDLEILSNIPKNKWAILAYSKESSNSASISKIISGNNKNLTYTGACVLCPEVFKKDMIKISESNTEFGLPQTFAQFANEKEIKVFKTKNWINITSPEDLS